MNNNMTLSRFSTLNLTLSGGLGVLGGLWLIVSPYLFDYNNLPAAAKFVENGQNATVLGLITGIITIAISVFLVATEKMAQMEFYRNIGGWLLVLMGVFLMAAPYLFNYSILRDPLWNLQLTGAFFTIIAGYVMQELTLRSKKVS